jgi:hypothetical protein
VGLAGESKWNVRRLELECSVRAETASASERVRNFCRRPRHSPWPSPRLGAPVDIGRATEGFAARILDLGFITGHWRLDPDTRSSAADTAAATAIHNQPSRFHRVAAFCLRAQKLTTHGSSGCRDAPITFDDESGGDQRRDHGSAEIQLTVALVQQPHAVHVWLAFRQKTARRPAAVAKFRAAWLD